MYLMIVEPDTHIKNKNIERAAMSEQMVLDMHRKDRRMPMKLSVDKIFHIVDIIWLVYTRFQW